MPSQRPLNNQTKPTQQDADGKIIIIDEVHTPDSSRYWVKETYDARLAQVGRDGVGPYRVGTTTQSIDRCRRLL